MATKEQKKYEKSANNQSGLPEETLMRFPRSMFYVDQETPIFDGGKVYNLQGSAWIQRWMKRGGQIVDKKDLSEKELKGVTNSSQPGATPQAPVAVAPVQAAITEEAPVKADEVEKEEEEKDNKGHKDHKDHKEHKAHGHKRK